MREDALDHHWIFDRSDDLQVTAALRAAFDIDVEQLVYTGIVWAVIIAAAIGLYVKVPLKVDVIRDRAAISREGA